MRRGITQYDAANEVARLRSALRKYRGVVSMVVTEAEHDEIWSLLTAAEKQRVRLLTSWPWDKPALASTGRIAA